MKTQRLYKKVKSTQKINRKNCPTSILPVHKGTESILVMAVLLILLLILMTDLGKDSVYEMKNDTDSKTTNESQIRRSRKRLMKENTFVMPFFVMQSLDQDITGITPSCEIHSCQVRCYFYGSDSFQDMITWINSNSEDCNQITLSIENTNFPNKTLSKGLLSVIKKRITHLSLKKSNIKLIDEAAFSGDPFRRLDYLTIEESDIEYIEKSTFIGTSLSTIEIRNNELRPINFEAGVFEYVRSTLQTLQLQSCLKSLQSLVNITGSEGSHFSYLTLLDLRGNNIEKLKSNAFSNVGKATKILLSRTSIESIDRDVFDRLKLLEALDLSNNQLSKIEKGTLDALGQLKEFDVSDNQLITLPYGLFRNNNQLVHISLQDNQWECNCSLVWLQKLYKAKRDLFPKPLYCGQIEFSRATFCPQTTSHGVPTKSTQVSTTEASTSTNAESSSSGATPATSPSDNLVTTNVTEETDQTLSPSTTPIPDDDNRLVIPCLRSLMITSFNKDLANNISLSQNKTSISFHLIDDDTKPKVQCNIRIRGENIYNMYLLVRDGSTGNFTCYYDISDHSFGINLDYGRPYSLCLIEKSKQQIDPFNCAAVTTPLEYNKRTWISNSARTIIIAGVTLFIIFMVLVTAFIVFCCIRQHPEFIKGNKRVIMVDARAVDALVMPKNYEYQSYFPPSPRSFSDGYLTPRTVLSERHYEMVPSPSKRRRPSCNSYRSPSYLRGSLMRRRNSGSYYENVYESPPPPLPPNHPSEPRYVRYPETVEFM